VKVRSVVEVDPAGRLRRLDVGPPLTVRKVHGESDVCTLCLVNTAAGPLPGDDLELVIQVNPGARARFGAAGATVGQGRQTGQAHLRTVIRVGADAELDGVPGALLLCDGADVLTEQRIGLAETASVRWHEILVLGRSRDSGSGLLQLSWDVERGGRPLLRQDVDLSDAFLRAWPGMTAGHRIIASSLLVGGGVRARTVVHGPFAAAQRLAADAELVTVLGNSAVEVMAIRDGLIAETCDVVAASAGVTVPSEVVRRV
jgi:urease accessory protein